MAPEELFSRLNFWMVNLCLKSYTFCLYFILYLYVWIRIHNAPDALTKTGADCWPRRKSTKTADLGHRGTGEVQGLRHTSLLQVAASVKLDN